MKLYISDLHLFHENAIKLDNRKFSDVWEMSSYIVEKWNEKVRGGDQVIVLGDMFWTDDVQKVNKILNKLNGKICLVEGNHDKNWLKKEGADISRFEWIKPYAELKDGKSIVIASHYPIMAYNHQYLKNDDGSDRTFMLYGHVHNTHDEILINQFQELTRRTVLEIDSKQRKIPCNMINCFCGFSDYTPLSLAQWIEVDKKRRSVLGKNMPFTFPDFQLLDDEP